MEIQIHTLLYPVNVTIGEDKRKRKPTKRVDYATIQHIETRYSKQVSILRE